MVQKERPTRRERNRVARHRGFLDAAAAIVFEEGVQALTMQRVADAMDCAVGTAYTYFDTKSALIAEVQRESIERLTNSYLLGRAALDRFLVDQHVPIGSVALTRVAAVGRFWVDVSETFPQETALMQALMGEQGELMSQADASHVLPAALRHLDIARGLLAEADAAAVLSPGDPWDRVVIWLASLSGVLQVTRLSVHDEALFDGVRLGADLNRALLLGWGADTDALAEAYQLVNLVSATGSLAPPLPKSTEHFPWTS